MDQTTSMLITAGVPTLAVLATFMRNEFALAAINSRITSLENRLDARIESLTRDMNSRFETLTRRIDAVDTDLREWARIVMKHETDIARLKDKAGLSDAA